MVPATTWAMVSKQLKMEGFLVNRGVIQHGFLFLYACLGYVLLIPEHCRYADHLYLTLHGQISHNVNHGTISKIK